MFFRAFIFLFVLPNVSDETNNTRFTRTIWNRVFGLALTEARHEIVEGILSPEGMALFSGPLVSAAQRQIRRCWRNNTNALHFAKILKGWSPEKILPLALRKS